VSERTRRAVFLVFGAGLLVLLVWSFGGLPDFGHYVGPYGDLVNALSIPERHSTDVVTTVNFDVRAFDTLGEEAILFAAVVGVAVLLRRLRDERERPRPDDEAAGRRIEDTSSAVRLLGLGLVGPTLVLGLYIAAHGQLTPGGGFQGGVILAAAFLLVFLSDQYITLRAVGPMAVIELAEAAGLAAFALIGLAGLIWSHHYLDNVLGLGTNGMLLSAGTIPLNSLATGLAVTGGFVFMLSEFLEQTLVVRRS
jgi:multicomponent Na+:H+ antiporter subunit B